MTSSQPTERHTRGWRIGTLGGAPVIVTAGWLLIAVVLVVLIGPWLQHRLPLGPLAYAWALAVPVLLFISVLAHELAHGLAAKARGIRAREYVITLWGGHTSFGSGLRTPADSAIVSVAGPAANVLLAVIGWAVGTGVGGMTGLAVAAFTYTNAFVAVFNILPALPMDGGKLLEAAVWRITGNQLRGTLLGGRTGQVLAVTVVVVSLGGPLLQGYRPSVSTAIWAVLVGVILWNGAHAAVRYAQAQLRADDVDLLALSRPAVSVELSSSVAQVADVAAQRPGEAIVLTQNGRPAGLVSPEAMDAVPDHARLSTPVSAVATPLTPGAALTQWHGSAAVAQVARAAKAGARTVVLTDPRHAVVAVVPVSAVVAHLGGRARR